MKQSGDITAIQKELTYCHKLLVNTRSDNRKVCIEMNTIKNDQDDRIEKLETTITNIHERMEMLENVLHETNTHTTSKDEHTKRLEKIITNMIMYIDKQDDRIEKLESVINEMKIHTVTKKLTITG